MADPIKPEEKTPEVKPEETPKDGYDYAKDHNKDIRTIAKETLTEEGARPGADATVDKPNETPEAPQPPKAPEKPEEPVNPLDEAKKYLEQQREQERVELERKAKEYAKEEITRTKEEETRELKEQEELKPIWEREGRAPKDYTEIAAENRRIVKLEWKREQRAEQEAEKKAQKLKEETQQKEQKEQLDSVYSGIGQEMEELYQGGYIPKPVKPGDPNDEGEKVKKALFEFGIKYNQERVAKGQPPEPSIAKIYFMHAEKIKESLKPKEVAGGDAPVSGAKPAVVKQEPEGYNYARDHKKSFRQLAMEEARRKAN
jgi:hypothetical protein